MADFLNRSCAFNACFESLLPALLLKKSLLLGGHEVPTGGAANISVGSK